MSNDRVDELGRAIDRQRMRHDALAAQVAELTRRLDRVELRLMLYALGGSAAGALVGSAGSAAARTLLGGG